MSENNNILNITSLSLLDQLNDEKFLEDHLIIAVEITAILERMGDRWPRRRDQVWEHLGRAIDQRLRDGERCQRITDTTFLIALARESRSEAIAVATHALQDSLHFFLGSTQLEDIHLQQVMSRVGSELTSEAVDAKEIRAAAAIWSDKGGAVLAGAVRQSPTLTLQTPSGQSLDVMIAVQQLRRLNQERPSAVRASPHISDTRTGRPVLNRERAELDFGDVAAIDAAVLSLARHMWEAEREMGVIIVPLSFHTLSRTGARSKLLSNAGIIADESRAAMICEMIDVAPGTPAGRICEAVVMTQVFTRGVFIEAKDPMPLKGALAGCRLLGLTFDASEYRVEQAASLTRKLCAFAEAGKTFARGLIAHSLPEPVMLGVGSVTGLTHAAASSRPVSPVVRINPAATRLAI